MSDNGEIATLGPATNELHGRSRRAPGPGHLSAAATSGTPAATNLAEPAAKPLSHLTLMDP